MDFRIPEPFLSIIKESDTRNSSDINRAITYLKKKIEIKEDIQAEIDKYYKNIMKLKNGDKKKVQELKLLDYLYKVFNEQHQKKSETKKKEYEERKKTEYEERKRRNEEIKRRNEEKKTKYEEKKRKNKEKKKTEYEEKIKLIDWDNIEVSLSDYIIDDLKKLLEKIDTTDLHKLITKKNINIGYDNYVQRIENLFGYFKDLWTYVNDFFKEDYEFIKSSEFFELEELKNVFEEYDRLIEKTKSNSLIDLAEELLGYNNENNKYENIILAIKISYTIFQNYTTGIQKNFNKLRKEFDSSDVPNKLIYFALFVNNNNIDKAKAFIEERKNIEEEHEENNNEENNNEGNNNEENNNEENNNEGNNGKGNNKPNSTFSTEIHNIRTTSPKTEIHNIRTTSPKTEAEIIQEYDDEVNKLHETQQNIFLFNNEKYTLLEFIREFLSNDDVYLDLRERNFINNLKIKDVNLATKYSNQLSCKIPQFRKKYIDYKIFECFHTKFREILDTIDAIQLYNSNRTLHNIFIRLIFFYSDDIVKYITLDNFLKLIACVIVFFYAGGTESEQSIEYIINEKITDNEERKIAIDHIDYLRGILHDKGLLKEEEYFKLFGRLKEKPFVLKKEGKSQSPPNQSQHQAEQYHLKKNYSKQQTQALSLPPKEKSKQPNTAHNNGTREQIVNRKIISTDEDKLQIIIKSFEDMDKKDSLLKPLLGFQKNILFEKNDEVAYINAIHELKKIYEKNKKILDYFFELLNILSQLIILKDKNKKDYFDIEKNANYLIQILEQLFDIFITSISEQSEKNRITQIFNTIKANIEHNIIDKYDDEKRKRFKHQEIKKRSPEDIDKYLKILGINIEEIKKESSDEIIKRIITQYKKLARKTHSDKTLSNTNNKFHTIINAKDNLISFYREQISKNNNNTNENNYNYTTNKFNNFKKKYLEAYPNFIPVESSAENYKNRENKIKYEYRKYLKNENSYYIESFDVFRKKFLNKYLKNYPDLAEEFNSHIIKNEYIKYKNEYIKSTKKKLAEFDKELLTDIIIPKIREPINIGKLTELTPSSLTELFKLFTPFNVLYDNKFKKFNSKYGNFILSIDNNLVIRFNLYISERHNNFNKYQQLCFNMDNYIKYILHNVSFIDNIENKDRFKIIIYYNFFHNLKSIMEIILDSLTDKDPRYHIFFNLKKKLEEIIIQFKKIDKDRQYSIVLDTEKNKSGIFAQNKFNVRKVGKEQLKKQRETIMKNTKQLFEVLNKNRTNTFYKKFDETKENKDKKILLLKEIRKLLDKLIDKYNISFENLVKSDNLKNIIESFFEKINTNLQENYRKDDISKLIDSLLRDKDKNIFLKKNIFEPVIKKLVEKLITSSYKVVKYNILELLYIFAISFSSENEQIRNIKQQRKNIKKVNNTTHQVLTRIKNEKQQQQLALIVIEQLKEKADQLEGTSASNQVKQDELKKTLIESMKKSKVSPALMALTLSTVKPTIPTNSGRQFMKGIRELLLTNSSKPKTPISGSSSVVVSHKTSIYNSLNAENKIKAVKELKSKVRKGNTTLKNDIQKFANELNRTKPNHITTIDEFKKEIDSLFKQKHFKLMSQQEMKVIQQLSKKYISNSTTEAKKRDILTKILNVIIEIKQDKSIKSLDEFKNKVQEKLESQTKESQTN